MTLSLDPSKIPDSAWQLFEVTPEYRRYRVIIDENGSYAQKTEFIADDKLVADNQQEFNDSYGKRFGDGRVVARIPLNVLYGQQSQITQKMREGDEDHLKWWLNSEAARPFRTFRGHI
jgi:hypothetical protein